MRVNLHVNDVAIGNEAFWGMTDTQANNYSYMNDSLHN